MKVSRTSLLCRREPASAKMEMGTPQEAAAEIKHVALAFGAGLVGITHYDQRWEYASRCSDMNMSRKTL